MSKSQCCRKRNTTIRLKNIRNLFQRNTLGFHVSEYSDDGIFCDGVQSGRYIPTIRRNLLSPSTGYKHWHVSSKLLTDNLEDRDSLKPHIFALSVEAHISSPCSAESGGNRIFRNVICRRNCTASHVRRWDG